MILTPTPNAIVFEMEPNDGSCNDFRLLIKAQYVHHKNNNIVVDLSAQKSVLLRDVLEFEELANHHKNHQHKSFVIVVGHMRLQSPPKQVVTAPTRPEALDLVEMEEIERDLGY